MDEATALILWGRQVLANRRLQRQREKLKAEDERKKIGVSASTIKGSARHTHHSSDVVSESEGPIRRLLSRDNNEEEGRKGKRWQEQEGHRTFSKGSGSHRFFEANENKLITDVPAGVVDVAQLKRRVEAARQSAQRLEEMRQHEETAFQHRKAELERTLERLRCNRPNSGEGAVWSAAKAQVTDSVPFEPQATPSLTQQSPMKTSLRPPQLQEQQLCRKQQLEELFGLQKALISSMYDERLAGRAFAALTACAHDAKDWDNSLWRSLREALHGWKLRLLPCLRHFYIFLQNLPVLPLPKAFQQEEQKDINDELVVKPLSTDQGDCRDVSANNLSDFTRSCGELIPPWDSQSYPLIESLEKQEVHEAITVAIDALARAARETLVFLSPLFSFADKRDVQLIDLLAKAEKRLELQESEIDRANALLGKVGEEKAALETDGAAIDDVMEQLQRKGAALNWQRERQQLQEKELQEELQQRNACLCELRQRLEKEILLKSEVLRQIDEHKRFVESAPHQKAALDEELRRLVERRDSLEARVSQLHSAVCVAQDEKEEAAEKRKRQGEEVCVAQLALETSKEAFMQRKRRHEAEQAEFMSLRCREHELQSQLMTAEEACQTTLAEVEARRAAETTARNEVAQLCSEMAQLQKEITAAQRCLHCTSEKLKTAQSTLLYGAEQVTATSPAAATAPLSPSLLSPSLPFAPCSTLAEVLRLQAGDEKSGIETAAPVSRSHSVVESKETSSNTMKATATTTWGAVSPQAREQAAEVVLIPRGVQREHEELRMTRLRLIEESRRQQQLQLQGRADHHHKNDKEVLGTSASHRASSLIVSPADDSNNNGVPLVVFLPSRRGESMTNN